LAVVLCAVPVVALAQYDVELGVLGLVNSYRSADVISGPTRGKVGFKLGFTVGGALGQNMGEHFGGELRYLFSRNDLKLTSGGTETTFGGRSHIVNYDFLFYFTSRDSRIRPFVAAGGGLKVYEGTGEEQAFQPLSNLALLTKTNETLPAGDFGGGIKFLLTDTVLLRIEFRDYVTKVPKVFERAPGATFDGILHHFAPAVGLSWTF
jgi:hypothetical protein